MAAFLTKMSEDRGRVPAPKDWGCAMRQAQDTILQRLGMALHDRSDGITSEPPPRRWVNLIYSPR
jgi:hypothetical protein